MRRSSLALFRESLSLFLFITINLLINQNSYAQASSKTTKESAPDYINSFAIQNIGYLVTVDVYKDRVAFNNLVGGDENKSNKNQFAIPISLFDKPKGKVIGAAKLIAKNDGFGQSFTVNDINIADQSVQRNYTDIQPGAYKTNHGWLKYYGRSSGYIRIFYHTYPGGVWIEENSINTYLKPLSYQDSFVHASSLQGLWGYNNRALREMPDIESNILLIIKSENHVIAKFTGNVDGTWAEVEVYRVIDALTKDIILPESITPSEIEERYTGWIEILQVDGQPKGLRWIAC